MYNTWELFWGLIEGALMSTLDMQIMSNIVMLPDIYKQPVLNLILSLQKSVKIEKAEEERSAEIVPGRRRLGIAKERKFIADNYDFDACNLEGRFRQWGTGQKWLVPYCLISFRHETYGLNLLCFEERKA